MRNLWWKQEKYQILVGLAACAILVLIWYKSNTIQSFYGDENYGYIRALDDRCRTIGVFVNSTEIDPSNFEPIYGPRPKVRLSDKKLIKVEQPWPNVFAFTIDMTKVATKKFSVLNIPTGKSITYEYPDLRRKMDLCLQDPNSYKLKIDENNTVSKNTFCNMVRHDIEAILLNCGKESESITERARRMLHQAQLMSQPMP